MVDGKVAYEGDMAKQTEQALLNVSAALEQFGASLADVVRTRIYVTDISRWAEAARPTGWPSRTCCPPPPWFWWPR